MPNAWSLPAAEPAGSGVELLRWARAVRDVEVIMLGGILGQGIRGSAEAKKSNQSLHDTSIPVVVNRGSAARASGLSGTLRKISWRRNQRLDSPSGVLS